ncbi:hypothetical protein ACNO65_17370, partial [Vibrio campbellii]|uniref:hypothetical protein n=1 Tax=Vibrio campbellii TaxID=680 RepID=UPI003AAE4725
QTSAEMLGSFRIYDIILVYDQRVPLVCESNCVQAQPLCHLFRNPVYGLGFVVFEHNFPLSE